MPESLDLTVTVAEAPLTVVDGLPIASASINGQGPFRVLVDSTASVLAVDDEIVSRLALTAEGSVSLGTGRPGSNREAPKVRIDRVAFGEAGFLAVDAAIVDLDAAGSGRSYDAVVGLPFFTGCLVTVNYVGGNLLVQRGELPDPDGRHNLAYECSHGSPVVGISSGDTTLRAIVDTTAEGDLVLAAADRDKIPTGTYLGLPGDPTKLISDIDLTRARAKAPITLGGFTIKNVAVLPEADRTALGRDSLREFTLIFDPKNSRVRFQRDADIVDRAPVSRYGYIFSRKGDGLIVEAVLPGSPAETRPLSEGDYVPQVEQSVPKSLSDAELRRMLRETRSIMFTVEKSGLPLMVVVNARED